MMAIKHVTPFCRHCKQEMYLQGVQEYPAKYNLPPLTLIHCINPGCPLWFQTFSKSGYDKIDLAPYLRGKEVKYYD